MLILALKHEKEKGSHSVVKEAREFVWEIDLYLEKLNLMGRSRKQKMLESWKELLQKRRVSVMLGSQNLSMANTYFKAKKLI